jgi:hypothetical protein
MKGARTCGSRYRSIGRGKVEAGTVAGGAGLNAPGWPNDATVRFALAWLDLYVVLIAGGFAGERDSIPRQLERSLNTASLPPDSNPPLLPHRITRPPPL